MGLTVCREKKIGVKVENVNRYRKRNFNCKNILTTKFKGTSISCLTIIVSYIILTLLSFLFFPQRNGRKLYHP